VRLIGIDGCGSGRWLLACGDDAPGAIRFELAQDLAPVFAEASAGRAIVAIDTPIGLPALGTRLCDSAARRLLIGRTSCVFNAPSRAALAGIDYVDACALNLEACGKSLSRQSYGILGLIAQVDQLITPELQERVREMHPEVTFAVLAGQPLLEAKKTAEGRRGRLEVLAGCGIEPDVERVRNTLGRGRVGADDVIDACAALVTAYRIHDGEALVLPPGEVQTDGRGLRMEMVA
jgi:predicted RNase H-like nuclease